MQRKPSGQRMRTQNAPHVVATAHGWPAGSRGSREPGSQCIRGGVDAWTSKLTPSSPHCSAVVERTLSLQSEGGVALAWGSESRDPEPTKTTAANPNRQSPIANCPMAKRRPIRRCGVAEPSWRCRQSAARRRMRRRDNRYCLVGAGCWDGRHDETGKPE